MPFPVDNIRAACQKQGTTLAEVERALGIGNGVIAKWEKKKGSPPYDRIIAIAEHLRVPVSDLTGEKQKEKPASEIGSGPFDYELLTDENKVKAQEYIRLLLNSQS